MNSRERVLTALTRSGVPDRVPLQFDLCRSLTDAFGEKLDIPIHYTTSYFEDLTYRLSANELRIAMGSDCVMVGGGLAQRIQPSRPCGRTDHQRIWYVDGARPTVHADHRAAPAECHHSC